MGEDLLDLLDSNEDLIDVSEDQGESASTIPLNSVISESFMSG